MKKSLIRMNWLDLEKSLMRVGMMKGWSMKSMKSVMDKRKRKKRKKRKKSKRMTAKGTGWGGKNEIDQEKNRNGKRETVKFFSASYPRHQSLPHHHHLRE